MNRQLSFGIVYFLGGEAPKIMGPSVAIEASCFPRSSCEVAATNKLLQNGPDRTYGLLSATGASVGPAVRCFYAQEEVERASFANTLADEASPLTGSGKVLSFAVKIWQGVYAELERARRVLVATEKDLEEGGSCDAFSFFSVTIRKPLTPRKLAAVGYSYLPYLLFFVFLLCALCTWAVLPLFAAVTRHKP